MGSQGVAGARGSWLNSRRVRRTCLAEGEEEPEVAALVAPEVAKLQARRLQLPFDPLPAELGRDLGAHLLALCELDLEAKVHDGHRLAFQGAQPHLDPLVPGIV